VNTSCTVVPSNPLLAALPAEAAAALHAQLELVSLNAGQMLHESGTPLRQVYFPCTATISLVSPLQNGAAVEVAVIGREGVVGVSALLGGSVAPCRAVVQRAGLAYRLSVNEMPMLLRDGGPLQKQLLRYTHALFAHIAQTSACNRHHSLGQQLCRWLLQHLDRQAGDALEITQERMAALLGVRRETVTEAALKLQRAGLIRYGRGHVQVLDRQGLEQRSCECHAVVRLAYERLGADAVPWSRRPALPAPQRERLSA
jgi:CRP-like cAMP-binding protein